MRVFFVLFYLCFGCVAGVEINDTQFAELPPLYALDDWAQCQRPEDVYCIVDALLVSEEPSSTLRLLQEYSKQTLKHYNRTLVHRGMCVSRCGVQAEGAAPWHGAAQRCLNESLAQYELQAEVLSLEWCAPSSRGPATGARALGVLCIVLVALALLATCLHILGERCAHVDGNRFLLAFSMKKNWEILTYDRSKPRSDERMKDLSCIEGIRVLGMQCVIFSHVMLIYIYSYTDNPQFIERMYDQFGWQAVLNSPLWLQAFFSMSAFLTTYSVLITMKEKPVTLLRCFMAVINRWVRLTPVAGMALWFTISWYPLLGAGPQWGWVVAREAHDCAERWWYHLLYVHNHLPLGKFCMGHTWYLAADMQLFVVCLALLWVVSRWRRAAGPLLALLVGGAALAAGLAVWRYRLTPLVTGQAPESLRRMFAGSAVLSVLYLPSWMNAAGPAGGAAAALALHTAQEKGIKLNQLKWFNIVYHLSLSLGSAVVLSGSVFLRQPSLAEGGSWSAVIYAALDRPLVAICFSVFLLGCCAKCKSALRDVFAWRGFHSLGRLSYCMFVIHFIVLRLVLGANTQLNHASMYSLITLFISVSALSYIAAIPICLLVELPGIELWKAIVEGDRRPERPCIEPQIETPSVKPLDLVANIRRRQDV